LVWELQNHALQNHKPAPPKKHTHHTRDTVRSRSYGQFSSNLMILTYNGSDSITDLERTVPAENTYMTHIKKYNTKQEKRSQKKENN